VSSRRPRWFETVIPAAPWLIGTEDTEISKLRNDPRLLFVSEFVADKMHSIRSKDVFGGTPNTTRGDAYAPRELEDRVRRE
jgi:hypothetical protein